MGIGLVVGVWVARYLGPEQFGKYNYALAFVALFSVCSNLGLDSIVIREIVRDPECTDKTLGTAFILKLAGAALTLVLSTVFIYVLRPGDRVAQIMVLIVAMGTFFQAFDTIDFWFQSQVRSRFTVIARNAAFILVSLIKIVLITTNASLTAFAWAGLAEIALGAIGLVYVYHRIGLRLGAWGFRMERARELLRESWPLMLSGVFVIILMKIDQVMLGNIRGDKEVGIFSAALKLSELWYFIPVSITASVFPAIVNARKIAKTLYYQRLKELYLLMTWLSLAVAIPLTLCSGQIIKLVYGNEYQNAATVLSIHCWAGVFIFWGQVSNIWYLLENLNHYTMYRCLIGAVINVSLNLFLIPRYGAKGAAISTLVTQIAASYLFDLINKPSRILFRIKTNNLIFFLPLTLKMWQQSKLPENSMDS